MLKNPRNLSWVDLDGTEIKKKKKRKKKSDHYVKTAPFMTGQMLHTDIHLYNSLAKWFFNLHMPKFFVT